MIFGSFQTWRMRKKVCLGIIINLQNHCVQKFYVIMQNLSGSCLHHCMCTYAYIEDKEIHTYIPAAVDPSQTLATVQPASKSQLDSQHGHVSRYLSLSTLGWPVGWDELILSFHNSAILAVDRVLSLLRTRMVNIKLLEMTCTHFCFTCYTACVKILKHVESHLLYEITCSPSVAIYHLLLIHLLSNTCSLPVIQITCPHA